MGDDKGPERCSIMYSLMLFKPSHYLYGIWQSHYYEQESQLPPRLSSFKITLPPDNTKLRQMVVPWKSREHRTPQSGRELGRSLVPAPTQGRLSRAIKLGCSGLYKVRAWNTFKDGDSPTSLGPRSTAGLSTWGKDFPNQLFIFQRLSEQRHGRKASMATKKQDISLSSKTNNVISKNP